MSAGRPLSSSSSTGKMSSHNMGAHRVNAKATGIESSITSTGTPEVITQVLMAIPLLVLYEISVWIAWYWERQDKKRQQAAEAAESK